MSWKLFADILYQAAASTSFTEWLAILTALAYVVLAAKENSWCWPFGIISSAIYIYLNYSVQLFLDAWLSVYYCIVGIYGWYAWIKGKEDKQAGSVLHRIKIPGLLVSLAVGTAGTLVLGKLSATFTQSPVPYFDAALTSFSLVATWLTTRKVLENWIFWIVIDAAYVLIYSMRHLPSTSILFLIYTFIAIYGFLKWRQTLKKSAV